MTFAVFVGFSQRFTEESKQAKNIFSSETFKQNELGGDFPILSSHLYLIFS